MKQNSAEFVREAVANLTKIAAEIPRLETLATDNSTALAALESTGNLESEKVIGEIVRRQAFAALFPRRIEARQNDLALAEQSLKEAVDGFISGELRSRVTEVAKSVRAKVRAALQFAFSDASALDHAVEQSELVQEVRSLEYLVTIEGRPADILAYANRKLAGLTKAAELIKRVA